METKICSKCKCEKGLEEFHFHDKKINKRRAQCKACIREKDIQCGRIKNCPKPVYTDSKPCSKCQVIKPIEEFYFLDKKKGKRRPDCKECCGKERVRKSQQMSEEERLERNRKQREYTLNDSKRIQRRIEKQTQKEARAEYLAQLILNSPQTESKTCSKCNYVLPIEEFHFANKPKNIRREECRECASIANRSMNEEKRDKQNERQRERRRKQKLGLPTARHEYTDYKPCSKCKRIKPMNDFWFSSQHKSQRSSECKECTKERRSEQAPHTNLPTQKTCSQCGILQCIDEFYFWDKKKNIRRPDCKTCCQQYNQDNAEHIKKRTRQYRDKPEVKARELAKREGKKRNKQPKPKMTPEERRTKNQQRARAKRKSDPAYALSRDIVSVVSHFLDGNEYAHRLTNAFFEAIGYTREQLVQHLTNQFEPWMTWYNRGVYDLETWDDNDPSTFRWHVDHIIPQSDLPYDNLQHPNFKKCWALSNLRPLSGKQNVIDGTRRTRHTTPRKRAA